MEEGIERIGLYGGTFAPPHLGHVYAAETFLRERKLHRLLIMPTAVPPHKIKADGDTPQLRCEMCRAAFGHLPEVEISEYEIAKGGLSYTVETLEHLRKPQNRVEFLCGSDMFMTLPSWYRAERIFELAAIVCIPRYDTDLEQLYARAAYYQRVCGAEVHVIGVDAFEASSTEVRQRIASGAVLTDCLPEPVAEIIRRHQLYGWNPKTQGVKNG